MNKEKIVESLKEIFSSYFNCAEKFSEENFDKALTNHFTFDSFDFVYLYILIEKKFNITIDSKRLKGYRFNTINGIIKVVGELI